MLVFGSREANEILKRDREISRWGKHHSIPEDYDGEHCWQYEKRIQNREEDIEGAIRYFSQMRDLFTPALGVDRETITSLGVEDFDFSYEEKDIVFGEVQEFIERHEWLGKMSLYPTHIYTARYRGLLSGVVIMDMPTAFSKLLGDDTREVERLISRGACISYSPKNLGSALIMYAIRDMVKTTPYRLFTAYSDPEARELGTIYQACNFYYLGKKSGTSYQYKIENGNWVSDRYFRSRSVYKRLARSSGIVWASDWQDGDSVYFDRMPEQIEDKIRQLSKEYMESCERKRASAKHKYAYVLGANRGETKALRKLFLSRNEVYNYPKERGD